jgi:hypothetical protein
MLPSSTSKLATSNLIDPFDSPQFPFLLRVCMCVYFFSGIRYYRSSGHGGSFWNKELQKMGLAQHLLENAQ